MRDFQAYKNLAVALLEQAIKDIHSTDHLTKQCSQAWLNGKEYPNRIPLETVKGLLNISDENIRRLKNNWKNIQTTTREGITE